MCVYFLWYLYQECVLWASTDDFYLKKCQRKLKRKGKLSVVYLSAVVMNRNGIPPSPRSLNTHFSLSLLPVLNAITRLHHRLSFFLMPARFCKQITPSEPGGACPSRWREEVECRSDSWLTRRHAQGKNKMRWRMDRARYGDRTEGRGGGGRVKKGKDTWCRGQEHGR